MISRMSGNGNGNGDITLANPLVWLVGATAASIALYQLFGKRPADQVAPVAPKEAPTAYADINAVATRFGQVRELWTMGYLSPDETLNQLTGLLTAMDDLIKSGKASPAGAQDLTGRVQKLMSDVEEYKRTQAASPA